MGRTVVQAALCQPVSAGRAILPSCSWRMLPRSPAPILHTWLEGKGTGDVKPRETRALGPPLPLVLHQEEEGGLPATADWALLHPVSLPLVPYTCFSSLEKPHKEQRGQTSFSLHAPAPLTADYGISGGSPGPVPSSASTKAKVAVCLLPPTS